MTFSEPQINSTIGISKEFNLSPSDLEHRGKSFLDEQALRRAGIRRVSDDVGHQILVIDRPQKDVEYHGLAVPYFNVWDSNKIIEYEIRRDKPDYEKNGDGKLREKRKYVKPRTTKNVLYVPPMTKAEWLKDKKKKIIFLTEGAFKALATARAASNDFTSEDWAFIPVAISGVDNFKTKTTETLETGEKVKVSAGLPEFENIEWKNTIVIICFDSDLNEKPNVKGARYRLTRFFREKKVKVFNLNFPKEFEGVPTKGIDDYLGAIESKYNTQTAIDSMLQLIDEAQKPKKAKSPIADNFELIKLGESEKPGVYYTDENGEKFKVCSPLEVEAETQTETGENYGRFLRWADSKSRVITWAMPIELVHGDGAELVKYLTSRGLELGASRNHYDKLKNYINLSKPDQTIICTTKLGWNGDAFVFPDETIGEVENNVVYQPEYATAHKFSTKGTLREWQENISKYCIGNSRLVFGVSLAFAPPLLPITGIQGGGFHNRGETSSGKTTVALCAGSVVGGSNDELGYCQSWKATANGLEAVAELHNHSLLGLDELAQIDGRQAADVGYMLANGEGKKRMAKTVTARRSLTWQLLFLSTGEISLADKMKESGLTIKGGQEVRVLDIPADTCEFGVFDDLHEFPDGQKFADYLRSASRKFYGLAIREFLRGVVELGKNDVNHNWQIFLRKFTAKILPENKKYPPEVYRAATRFALVAFAGEMATKLEITKWQPGEATTAAETVFQAWFANRNGRGTSDAERAISQLRAFIEAHGVSRFEILTSTDESLDTGKIINRAGFRKLSDAGELEYLFLPETFRAEVCKGFDYKFVCRILDERGFLRCGSKGFQKQLKYGGVQVRPYWVSSRILTGSDEGDKTEKAKVADTTK